MGPSTSNEARHVVVVDDDVLIRTLMTAFLAKLGCRSTMCADGASASAEIARAGASVCLVLIDLRLGAVNGVEVCRRLRAEGVRAPILCMSGDLGSTDRASLDEAGFDGALQKPISLQELETCIAKHAPLG